MTYQHILFSIDQGVARLTLNRPDKLNSFNVAMHEEVRDALTQVNTSNGVRVLVLTGAGRGFCAGQDLSDRAVSPGQEAVDLGASIEKYYGPLVLALRNLPVPVICAVNGVAAGAGANLALAADIVIATKSASFIEVFCRLGLIPDTGGTYFLPRLVGTARAIGMSMLGEKISADQAEQWGLIWKSVDDNMFQEEIQKLVTYFSSAPTVGMAKIKHTIYGSAQHTLEEQLNVERDTMRALGKTADYREGVAAFIEKRVPAFQGK